MTTKPLPELGFYIKYWNEMEALFNEYGPSALMDLSQHSQAAVKKVKEAADLQAHELLRECWSCLESRFDQFDCCRVIPRKRMGARKETWEFDTPLRVKGSRAKACHKLYFGAMIDRGNDEPSVFLYLFGNSSKGEGPHAAEDVVAYFLRERVVCRSGEMNWSAGTVAFASVPIRFGNDFRVRTPGLLDRVAKAAKQINDCDIKAIFEEI